MNYKLVALLACFAGITHIQAMENNFLPGTDDFGLNELARAAQDEPMDQPLEPSVQEIKARLNPQQNSTPQQPTALSNQPAAMQQNTNTNNPLFKPSAQLQSNPAPSIKRSLESTVTESTSKKQAVEKPSQPESAAMAAQRLTQKRLETIKPAPHTAARTPAANSTTFDDIDSLIAQTTVVRPSNQNQASRAQLPMPKPVAVTPIRTIQSIDLTKDSTVPELRLSPSHYRQMQPRTPATPFPNTNNPLANKPVAKKAAPKAAPQAPLNAPVTKAPRQQSSNINIQNLSQLETAAIRYKQQESHEPQLQELYAAIKNKDNEQLDRLIATGLDLRKHLPTMSEPTIYALQVGNIPAFTRLLNTGLNNNYLYLFYSSNEKIPSLKTLLSVATTYHLKPVVSFLLKKGAQIPPLLIQNIRRYYENVRPADKEIFDLILKAYEEQIKTNPAQ